MKEAHQFGGLFFVPYVYLFIGHFFFIFLFQFIKLIILGFINFCFLDNVMPAKLYRFFPKHYNRFILIYNFNPRYHFLLPKGKNNQQEKLTGRFNYDQMDLTSVGISYSVCNYILNYPSVL